MSMGGCFGDCDYEDDHKTKGVTPKLKIRNEAGIHVVFHPPIQTVFREKEPTKWYTDMVNSLAALGSNPNQLNQFGQAPLCMAAHRAQGWIVKELLQRDNINVNIKGKHGRTPLYLAAEEGHVYIVKQLLLHPNIDVNCRNAPRGATALMAASRRGHSRVVELLLQHLHIIPDLTDIDGNNAFKHARTASVKVKLHSHTSRSRSLENVIPIVPIRLNNRNICHVDNPSTSSNSTTSSSSSLDSVGESAKGALIRQHSLENKEVLENLKPLKMKQKSREPCGTEPKKSLVRTNHQSRPRAEFKIDIDLESRNESSTVHGAQSILGAKLESSEKAQSDRGSNPESRDGAGQGSSSHSADHENKEKTGSVSPRGRFFRGSRSSLHSLDSPSKSRSVLDSPSRSPLSVLSAKARNIFHFGEVSGEK